MNDVDVDAAALRLVAEEVAVAAGHLLAEAAHRADRDEGDGRDDLAITTKSTPTDMVTAADRAAEALIVERLTAARPHDGILGEEGTSRPGTSGVRWVVDPLDGTTNFVYGHPGYAVSVAAEVGGVTVAAAVVDVVHGEVFTAARGGGATRDGRPISPSPCRELRSALVATGFSYDPARRGRQAGALVHLLPQVRDIRRMGAAAVDLCSVACGRVDAYYEVGLAPWDLAAGALVAAEAGAVVRPLGPPPAGPAGPMGVSAAAPGIADAFAARLARAGAADV